MIILDGPVSSFKECGVVQNKRLRPKDFRFLLAEGLPKRFLVPRQFHLGPLDGFMKFSLFFLCVVDLVARNLGIVGLRKEERTDGDAFRDSDRPLVGRTRAGWWSSGNSLFRPAPLSPLLAVP